MSAAKRSSSSPWTPHYPAALGPTPSTTSLDEASTVAADEDQVVDRNNAAMAGELPLSPEDLSSDVSHSARCRTSSPTSLKRPSGPLTPKHFFFHPNFHSFCCSFRILRRLIRVEAGSCGMFDVHQTNEFLFRAAAPHAAVLEHY